MAILFSQESFREFKWIQLFASKDFCVIFWFKTLRIYLVSTAKDNLEINFICVLILQLMLTNIQRASWGLLYH